MGRSIRRSGIAISIAPPKVAVAVWGRQAGEFPVRRWGVPLGGIGACPLQPSGTRRSPVSWGTGQPRGPRAEGSGARGRVRGRPGRGSSNRASTASARASHPSSAEGRFCRPSGASADRASRYRRLNSSTRSCRATCRAGGRTPNRRGRRESAVQSYACGAITSRFADH